MHLVDNKVGCLRGAPASLLKNQPLSKQKESGLENAPFGEGKGVRLKTSIRTKLYHCKEGSYMENEKRQVEEAGNNEDEIDGVELENENLKRELQAREVKISGLEKSLAEKDSEIAAGKKTLEEAKQVMVETAVDLSQAVAAYKELAGQANPGLVKEMIKGETIMEVNASLKSAKELVEKVKQEVGAETARVRVPAGAPPRAAPDLSVLTAREKIRWGVGGKNQ